MIKLRELTKDDKKLVYNLLQFALYDGSQYIENKIDDEGVFQYKYFENYFKDNDRYAYLIEYQGEVVGFTFINKYLKIFSEGYSIAEFLILPNYRRLHIGSEVCNIIFSKFKGNFEIEPIPNSETAYKFWKKVISNYTNDNYKENNVDGEIIFTFTNK